jgi:hypothetical protein
VDLQPDSKPSTGIIRLRDVAIPKKIKIGQPSDPVKQAELAMIEHQMEKLTMPDFGYGAANFALDFESRPRNWQLLAGYVTDHNNSQWLSNHIRVEALKKKLIQLRQEREQVQNQSKKQQVL